MPFISNLLFHSVDSFAVGSHAQRTIQRFALYPIKIQHVLNQNPSIHHPCIQSHQSSDITTSKLRRSTARMLRDQNWHPSLGKWTVDMVCRKLTRSRGKLRDQRKPRVSDFTRVDWSSRRHVSTCALLTSTAGVPWDRSRSQWTVDTVIRTWSLNSNRVLDSDAGD